MMLLDAVLYQALAWYVSKVRPGTLGLPQPWYFPLLPSYWKGNKGLPELVGDEAADVEKEGNARLEVWEPPASHPEVAVKIRSLEKIFARGKRALKGITLDMHR